MPSYDTLKPLFENEEKAIAFFSSIPPSIKRELVQSVKKNDIKLGKEDV
jgi:hypothetical protein